MTEHKHTKPLDFKGFREYWVEGRAVQIFHVGTGHTHVAVRVEGRPTEYSKSHPFEDEALADYAAQIERLESAVPRAKAILFRATGEYHAEEMWRIPGRAVSPRDMERSPDFHRVYDGAVLIEAQEPWGYPHLIPGRRNA